MAVSRKPRAKRLIKNAVRKLRPEEVKEALGEVREELEAAQPQARDRVPGAIIAGYKTIYTRTDLDRVYGITTFTPQKTIPVTLQGQLYQLLEGIEITCPKGVQVIYERHLERERQAGRKIADMSGFITEISLGAGPLPPE